MNNAVWADRGATEVHLSTAAEEVRTDFPRVALPCARVAEWQTRRV